ncbi:serine/threonine protein kinase [Candidatus Uabimicrobium amorphum]|uniref:Protein kinase n=1 Tax=Uabimicrobium amorphum TaxID=2596890 RepID=A0A5S9IW24_UABAM|nr:serine/threonine-protein kinase [Candidatus Uabimicrobium amorphum]BBM87615.1 protein kinase [Candidatus Uabimicrobium amorphum]
MDSWYIYNKKQQKKYGPYSQVQIKSFVHNQKIDETCVASNNQKTWYNAQQLEKMLPVTNNIQKIGKFEVIRELGRGGMGVVYHARDTFLNDECAVKFIRLDQMDENTTKRFIREAQSTAKLKHPNIIAVKELNSIVDAQGNHLYYFSMDYIKGLSFGEYIAQDIPLKDKLGAFVAVCRGVAYAHENNIIHRDLKPANIIVAEDGTPIILDFGIARDLDITPNMTKTGDIVGTPRYIAPEVMEGKKATASCDTYALGVILYEILTGFSPFSGENVIEILFQVSHSTPVRPSRVNDKIKKDEDIEVICLKCLEKRPRNRIHSVGFLCEELQCVLDGKPTKTKPPGFMTKNYNWFRKNKLPGTIIGIMLIIIPPYLFILNNTLDEQKRALQEKQQAIEQQNIAMEEQRRFKVKSSFENYDKVANDKLMQFYEKFSSAKGIHSILGEMKGQYEGLEERIEDKKYHSILVNEKQNIQNFFNSTQKIIRYFLLPSLPKITSKIELTGVKDIYQIGMSTNNDIALISKARQLYMMHSGNNIPQQNIHMLSQKKIVGTCNRFCFSNNGRYLAAFFLKPIPEEEKSEQRLLIYDMHAKQVIKSDAVWMAMVDGKFSPNGRYFAYSSLEKGPSLWDLYSDKPAKEICKKRQGNKAKHFEFSSSGKYVSFHVQNDGYYVYDIQKKHTRKLAHYLNNVYPVWRKDQLFIYSNTRLERYDLQVQEPHTYSFTPNCMEGLASGAVSFDGKKFLWGTEEGTLNYVSLVSKNKANVISAQQAFSKINKIAFLNEHFFFTLDGENHFYLRDLLSRQAIYHQPNVYYARYDEQRNEIIVVVQKKQKFYLERWRVPYTLRQLLLPNRKTENAYKLVTKLAVDEKLVSSHPALFVKKGKEIKAVILSWHKALSIWQKKENTFANSLTFSPLLDLRDIKLSHDDEWLVILAHHKRLRKQYVIKIHCDNLAQLDLQNSDKIIDGALVNGQVVNEWVNNPTKKEIRCVALSPNNDLYVSYSNEIWKYTAGKIRKLAKCSRTIRVLCTQPEKGLMIAGQEKNFFSILDANGRTLYTARLEESENVFEIAAWCPQNEQQQAMCAIAGKDGHLYLVYEGKNGRWQHHSISLPGKKYQLSFSPNGKMLAVFTSRDTYLYSIDTQSNFPIFSGYHKNNGGNFCRDWQYAVFPTAKARVFIFDLHKLSFANFANYFSDTPVSGENLWVNRVKNKFSKLMQEQQNK